MKKNIYTIVFTLFVAVFCAFTAGEKWYQFESTPFGFKVEFPAKPVEKTKTISTLSGEVTLNMFEYASPKENPDVNLVYMASYVEYAGDIDGGQKDKQKALCRKVVDDAVSRLKGKLVKENVITLEGNEGVEARIEYKDGAEVLRMKMYLVKNKMYMLETVTEMTKDNNKSISRFMDSFKLMK
jgi:hypothetical protein